MGRPVGQRQNHRGSGSTIDYDPKALKGAKGDMAAFDLASGKAKWRKDMTGGVVACAALADGLAVVLRHRRQGAGLRLATGELRWIYERRRRSFAARGGGRRGLRRRPQGRGSRR